MGTKSDSFRALNETCPIMGVRFCAIYKHIDTFAEIISQEAHDKLIELVIAAEREDSDIRHKFRDIHIDALDLAQSWEIKHDKLNDELSKKDDEIKELEEEISDKKDEIGSLEDTINELNEKVKKLQKEIDTMEIA